MAPNQCTRGNVQWLLPPTTSGHIAYDSIKHYLNMLVFPENFISQTYTYIKDSSTYTQRHFLICTMFSSVSVIVVLSLPWQIK